LARLGIREFKPMLRSAPQLLETLCTPEGATLPPNTLAELRRDMARLSFVKQQINEVESARLERLQRAPGEPGNAMVGLLTRVVGVGVETADMLLQEIFSRNLRDRKAVARYAGLELRTRAVRSDVSAALPNPATLACAVGCCSSPGPEPAMWLREPYVGKPAHRRRSAEKACVGSRDCRSRVGLLSKYYALSINTFFLSIK
jgi:hypothetical protein